jgi:hypothetical protein
LVARHAEELGVKPLPFSELVYLPEEDRYEEATRVPAGRRTASLSGTQVREEYLRRGRQLSRWFTRPEVAAILAEAHPPRHRQGFCLWFTGLSGAGKSTTPTSRRPPPNSSSTRSGARPKRTPNSPSPTSPPRASFHLPPRGPKRKRTRR